jgi:hypothetical protein
LFIVQIIPECKSKTEAYSSESCVVVFSSKFEVLYMRKVKEKYIYPPPKKNTAVKFLQTNVAE